MNDKATVLFVDDEERILRSLKMLFRGQYNVITTTSGKEALNIARQQKIHVLVSDQRMPEMMGVDLLRQMRELSPATMRLLLTGYSDLNAIIGSINEGEIFRFISKPWKIDELKTILAEAAGIAMQTETGVTEEIATDHQEEKLLIIDSDAETVEQVRLAVGNEHRIHQVDTLDEALDYLASQDVAVVISESRLDKTDLTATLKMLRRFNPEIVTIVLTAFNNTAMLVDLINHGQIYRFLPKPIRKGLLDISLKSAIRHHRRLRHNPQLLLRHKAEAPKSEPEINAANRVMQMLKNLRQKNAGSTLT